MRRQAYAASSSLSIGCGRLRSPRGRSSCLLLQQNNTLPVLRGVPWRCSPSSSTSRLRLALVSRSRSASFCTSARCEEGSGSGSEGESGMWSTPLAKTIAQAIETTGPISIAAYMRQCLTAPHGGYYTTRSQKDGEDNEATENGKAGDQFGRKGDFITSPEISQVFGELVGIWFMTEWMAQTPTAGQEARGKKVQLIEMGPGRATLMADILRTTAQFKSFAACVEGVYLVEASEALRETQRSLLCGEAAQMIRTEVGWRSETDKYGSRRIPVVWVEDIGLLPKAEQEGETMPLIVAHEFFDALPIHAFEAVAIGAQQRENARSTPSVQSTGQRRQPPRADTSAGTRNEWRELLIAPRRRQQSPSPILTQKEVEESAAAESSSSSSSSTSRSEPPPDFQLVRADSSTPTSLVVPQSSPRYKRLLSQTGSTIEISTDSQRYISELARRIGGSTTSDTTTTSKDNNNKQTKNTGAALIIDYGPENPSTPPHSSLRAIKSHRHLSSPLTLAGRADLSADVDFGALAEAASRASPAVEVWGPVLQADFLARLGGWERVDGLVRGLSGVRKGGEDKETEEAEETDEEERRRQRRARDLQDAWGRLVDKSPSSTSTSTSSTSPTANGGSGSGGGGMGQIYKVLSIVPENAGQRPPVGFGGRVVVGGGGGGG